MELNLEVLYQYRESQKQRKIFEYFPKTGPLRKELYPKHVAFFTAGCKYRVRVFMAANRVGKSDVALYEVVLHATGLYPADWTGYRFDRPVKFWVCGDTGKSVRETLQEKLIGPMHDLGTGFIPGAMLKRITRISGISDAVDKIYVTHVSGGISEILLKSYDQRRIAFQGAAIDGAVLDEECDLDIFGEVVTRTMTTKGMVMIPFTPLNGVTPLVQKFLNTEDDSHFLITATWDDAPHLSEEDKKSMLAAYPEYQRDARSKGIPSLGSGAVFTTAIDDLFMDSFPLPEHWPCLCAIDVGWTNGTAAVWVAFDKDEEMVYVYNDYKKTKSVPNIHALSILAHGDWLNFWIDPASGASSQMDGRSLFDEYRKILPNLRKANNAVEASIMRLEVGFATGKIRIFNNCTLLKNELSYYRRDSKGKIVKENDHVIDCLRYAVMAGVNGATINRKKVKKTVMSQIFGSDGWMA